MNASLLTIIIPTYRREAVLLETVELLLALRCRDTELLIVDQTEDHDQDTLEVLKRLSRDGSLRWLRQVRPSIPAALNRGLLDAKGEIILFLDDDIVPDPQLVDAHRAVHREQFDVIVAGRVLQPWHFNAGRPVEHTAPFTGKDGRWVDEFMGGNFSIPRSRALALGGFDENFVKAAYRFEAEFARRHITAGGRIWYEPMATIRHLHVSRGGTRSYGSHLTTAGPAHAVGAYYFTLISKGPWRCVLTCFQRAFGSVLTRHHLRHPWWIPVTLLAELRGFLLARSLRKLGPRLIRPERG